MERYFSTTKETKRHKRKWRGTERGDWHIDCCISSGVLFTWSSQEYTRNRESSMGWNRNSKRSSFDYLHCRRNISINCQFFCFSINIPYREELEWSRKVHSSRICSYIVRLENLSVYSINIKTGVRPLKVFRCLLISISLNPFYVGSKDLASSWTVIIRISYKSVHS